MSPRLRVAPAAVLCLLALSPLAAARADTTAPKALPDQLLAVLELHNKLSAADKARLDSGYLTNQVRTAALELPVHPKVITRENITDILTAQGKSLEECQGECETDTGRRLGADLVISGELLKFGDSYKLTLLMHETQHAQLVSTAQVSAKSAEELDQGIRAAVLKLFAPLLSPTQTHTEGKIVAQGGAVAAGAMVVAKFDSEPQGAIVMLDGQLLCQSTPCQKSVTAGPHLVAVQKENYKALSETRTLGEGAALSFKLAPTFAVVTIVTKPAELALSVDGKSVKAQRLELPAGAHKIVLDEPCFLPDGEALDLNEGDTRALTIEARARTAPVTVTAVDTSGNDTSAEASIDGKALGKVPGVLAVPICTKKLGVKGQAGGAVLKLDLKEGVAQTQVAHLAPGGGSDHLLTPGVGFDGWKLGEAFRDAPPQGCKRGAGKTFSCTDDGRSYTVTLVPRDDGKRDLRVIHVEGRGAPVALTDGTSMRSTLRELVERYEKRCHFLFGGTSVDIQCPEGLSVSYKIDHLDRTPGAEIDDAWVASLGVFIPSAHSETGRTKQDSDQALSTIKSKLPQLEQAARRGLIVFGESVGDIKLGADLLALAKACAPDCFYERTDTGRETLSYWKDSNQVTRKRAPFQPFSLSGKDGKVLSISVTSPENTTLHTADGLRVDQKLKDVYERLGPCKVEPMYKQLMINCDGFTLFVPESGELHQLIVNQRTNAKDRAPLTKEEMLARFPN